VNEGSKGVLLGLGDPVRELPSVFQSADLPAGVTTVRVFCPGCIVIDGPRYDAEPHAAARIAQHPALAAWPLVVLSDEPLRATASEMNFLWTTFTRFEPAADIHAAAQRVVRHHVSSTPPIVIDARIKPWFPKEVECDPDTAAIVSQRWRQYFPHRRVEMGDSSRGHLDPPASR
jgi:hypothetical protein